MSDNYGDADHRFDAEQLHGPVCPRHGAQPCGCCRECGAPDGVHARDCPQRDEDDGDAEPMEHLSFYAIALDGTCQTPGCDRAPVFATIIIDSRGREPLAAAVCAEHCQQMRNDLIGMAEQVGGEVKVNDYLSGSAAESVSSEEDG